MPQALVRAFAHKEGWRCGSSRRRGSTAHVWRMGVRGDARAETRFHFRTDITGVVPWLVVSQGEQQPSPASQL